MLYRHVRVTPAVFVYVFVRMLLSIFRIFVVWLVRIRCRIKDEMKRYNYFAIALRRESIQRPNSNNSRVEVALVIPHILSHIYGIRFYPGA